MSPRKSPLFSVGEAIAAALLVLVLAFAATSRTIPAPVPVEPGMSSLLDGPAEVEVFGEVEIGGSSCPPGQVCPTVQSCPPGQVCPPRRIFPQRGFLGRSYPSAYVVPVDTSASDHLIEVATARPWQVCVRLNVDTPRGLIKGSGTVIYCRAEGALILTCAHVFKGANDPKTFRSPIVVDLFDGVLGGSKSNQVKYTESFLGRCVDFDQRTDVGLIALRPGKVLPSVRPVEAGWMPRAGERMTTVGCSLGADATAWSTSYLQTINDRPYLGLECSGSPQQGRSGGGLFRNDGKVAGVCDFQTDQGTGIYAAPPSIHQILDRNNLRWVYTDTGARSNDPDLPSASGVTIPLPNWFNPRDPLHYGMIAAAAYAAATFLRRRVTSPTGPVSTPTTDAGSLLSSVRELVDRVKSQEEREKRNQEATELLDKFKALLSGSPADSPKA